MSKILIEKFDKFIEKGEYNKIIEKIKSLSEDKKNYQINTYLARAYNGQGKYDEALKVLINIEKDGEKDYLWHYRMGHNYYYLNEKENALKYFKQAFSLAPDDIWTLFFLRKLNMRFNIYEDKKTYDTLTLKDFIGEDESYETLFSIFERDKVLLNIYLEDSLNLEDKFEDIKNNLKWLEENKDKIYTALLENNIVTLAEQWASSGIPVKDEKEEYYIIEDSEKVSLPITTEIFLKSLYPESIDLEVGEENTSTTISFCCYPDYFAGHCLVVEIDSDKNIECVDLAG